MTYESTRRGFLGGLLGACAGPYIGVFAAGSENRPTPPSHAPASGSGAAGSATTSQAGAKSPGASQSGPNSAAGGGEFDFPLIDYHVHLDNSSLDQVLPLSKERGVQFGIVEHAGTRQNKYPVVLSNDDELHAYIKNLEGRGVYKGIQAEWSDWAGCFSKAALSELDFVLTDAMTFPGTNGQRVKLWEPGASDQVDMSDRQSFMARYVDWHVQIISTEPIDILANVSWLPAPLADDYDAFWTESRVRKVAEAAVQHGVAIEINSRFNLPTLGFLKIAKAVGVKFSFGSNGRYPNMGKIDYCLSAARELGLKRGDMFTIANKTPLQG